MRKQHLLGGDDSKYKMELLKNSTEKPQHFGKNFEDATHNILLDVYMHVILLHFGYFKNIFKGYVA